MTEWKPTTATELAHFVAENYAGQRQPLTPVGGRTALHFGYSVPEQAVPVGLHAMNRLIDYPARDMTVTVESGMRIEDLQQLLAKERQRLPIDLAESHRATVGGAIACDAHGPSRFGYGTFRDYVIGISAVDGQGRLFSGGGRVVKNVAGYDVCKLMTGSLGVLGIITQVTLKLRPLAEVRGMLWAGVPDSGRLEPLLEALNLSATRPVILDLLNPKAAWQIRNESKLDLPADFHVLCLGYEGSEREVGWQLETAVQELMALADVTVSTLQDEPADSLWNALTDFQTASDDPVSFRAGVAPSRTVSFVRKASEANIAVQAHAGLGVVIGHLPDRCPDISTAQELIGALRQQATENSGALVVTQCDSAWCAELDLFGVEPTSWRLMRDIKRALDPAELLNPGKLWR